MTIVPHFLPRRSSDFELQMMPVIESMSFGFAQLRAEAGFDKNMQFQAWRALFKWFS